MRKSSDKESRHSLLQQKITEDPFLTDGQLADILQVSVPTVRLDRMMLGIPELRERVKNVASVNFDKVKTLGENEFVGSLVDLQLGVRGVSSLNTTSAMCFSKSMVVRGHVIYSLAECLAISIVDATVALVEVANIKYKVPVKANARLIARGEVKEKRDNVFIVWIKIYDEAKEVFGGKFILKVFDI